MATRFYLTDQPSPVTIEHDGDNINRAALLSRGATLVVSDATDTVAGPAEPKIKKNTSLLDFWTPPVKAVTLVEDVTANVWMAESNAAANVGGYVVIQRCDRFGNFIEPLAGVAVSGEMAVGTRTAINVTFGLDAGSIVLNSGDRIRIGVLFQDEGGTQAAGHTVTLGYNGPTSAADGDSWIEFTEDLTVLADTGRRYKRFVGPRALSSAPETLYTVPYNGRSVIRNIYANNPFSVDAALTLGIALPDAYADEVLADSPRGFWKLQEASGLPQDSSGNALHMETALSDGIYRQTGPMVDYAILFDRAEHDGYYRTTGAPLSTAINNFTVECWWYPVSDPGASDLHTIVNLGPAWVLSFRNGRKFEFTYFGVADMGLSTATLTLNTWNHIVCKRDAGTTYYYLNGVLDSTKGTNTPDTPTTAFAIGVKYDASFNTSIDGRLAYVAYYETALSTARVAAHYEAAQAPDGIFDEDTVPASDILFARRDTNYVLEAGEMLQGFATPVLNPSYSEEVLADSPAAYYRMNEASGQPQDLSGNSRHTTVTGGTPTYAQAGALGSDPSNDSILFGGDYFTTPDSGLDLGDVWTLECWLRRTSTGAAEAFVDKGSNAYSFGLNSSNQVTMASSGSALLRHSSVTITDTTWHHIVATKNGSTCAIYIDGVDVTVFDFDATTTDNATALRIGDTPFTGSPVNGYMDEVAVYPTALSAVRILAHYTAGIGRYVSEVLADSPVGYWRMDEASGLIQDSSGNGNHATGSTGTPAYSQAGAILSSIYFNGDTMQVPDHSTLDVGDVFSLEAWVKRTTTGVQEVIFDKWTDTPAIHINSDNTFSLMLTNTEALAHSTSTITDTDWHHIVATKNGASIFLYLDGVDDTGTIDNTTACTNNTTRLEIGGTQLGTALCNSYLDELAWYGTVLSPERVAAHYAAATSFPFTPVLDDFNRANGALGSNWGVIFSGDGVPTIWTNAMVGVSSAENSAYWNVSTYEDCQVYCDMDDDTWGTVMARISDPNSGVENLMLGRFRADTDEILFGIVYNGALVTGDWLNTINVTVPAACQIGMTVTNDGNDFDLEFFINGVSQGTYTVTNGAVSYPDLAAAGYIGAQLYGGGNTLDRSIDNFGGGSLSPILVVDGVEYGL